ncbi:Lrp/AsnC family transcriptional regulator [Paracoccus sp. (in: a-proteobacteria)]|uniref:Lrp/AsnC family transcriptional regulator n=1 Tax=Paracoccus sp. TaxID=267 RepID=UPI00289E32BB|nr:Lrp/AsnC family transcriptional regulator [Paracoccus sp. (in: a-proteobacteria)]
MIELDDIDRHILTTLREDGRIPILNLSERVGLSPTPCGRRVKRMEDAGVIQGYFARIDPAALGLNINVFISVRLGRHGPEDTQQFLSAIAQCPEVTECLLVTGNVDYVLRVWVRDVDALGTFVRDVLQSIPAVAETSTMVILKQGANLLASRE